MWDFIISAVAFVVVFSVIILVHEFGHFWTAKKVGIKVEEFGIGLPPRIWGKKIKGTIYSFNWIPFGGFVRLYGEDGSDPKLLKDKKSFVGKSLRQRMAVVVAGVFMNFVLAVSLLAIGFSIGIEPLLVNGEDVLKAINEEIIDIDNGVRIKSVDESGVAYEAGLLVDDIIISVNGIEILDPEKQLEVLTGKPESNSVSLEVLRGEEKLSFILDKLNNTDSFGIELYGSIYLPRVFVHDVLPGSETAKAGIIEGDIITAVNGKPVYTVSDYQDVVNTENEIQYNILRNFKEFEVLVSLPVKQRTVVVNTILDSAAYNAGFKAGDVIVSINGTLIEHPNDAIEITKASPDKDLVYVVNRDGSMQNINVKPSEEGLIGVGLISMNSYQNTQLSVYNSDVLTSVKEIHDVKYPVHIAIKEAFSESGRLAQLTVGMLGELVRSVTSKLVVPEGVSGPVGIARLTHVFVQDGLLALLRFMALLSLSLAVLNIIPFPALDGGRLFFLLIEAVRGKRIPQKWESAIHALGFLVLIAFLFFVTYSDILQLF
ncbi:RIP metalloprotease RseP [bacterium]|nr:RIP metalloprotease RseP [bacterium]